MTNETTEIQNGNGETVRTIGPEIYRDMHAVMKSVEGLAKRDRNEHHRFNFRGIDATVNALGPAFREHGVIVVPNVQHVEYEKVHTSQNKPATACRVIVDYIFYSAKDGSSIVATAAGEAWDNGDKATPKAMSVAFRTALLQSFILPTDERDPDAETYEQSHEPMASKEQIASLTEAFKAHDLSGAERSEERREFFKGVLGRETGGGDLTAAEVPRLISALADKGPTAEQEQMLAESLGAEPITDNEPQGEGQ